MISTRCYLNIKNVTYGYLKTLKNSNELYTSEKLQCYVHMAKRVEFLGPVVRQRSLPWQVFGENEGWGELYVDTTIYY